jgi:hypothetical protein
LDECADFQGNGSRKKKIIFAGSGQDVGLAQAVREKLLEKQGNANITTRVVSMPCWELFEKQSDDYRKSIISDEKEDGVLRVYIEMASNTEIMIGDKGRLEIQIKIEIQIQIHVMILADLSVLRDNANILDVISTRIRIFYFFYLDN